MIAKRAPEETNDSVNLIVSLLVRHPELSRIIIKPRSAAIAFFFIVRAVLDAGERSRFRRSVVEHTQALRSLGRGAKADVAVRFSSGDDLTFVEIERDAKSIGRDEIAMLVGLVSQTFGERLVVNPPAEEGEDDASIQEESVVSALDAVQRGRQRKGLVGFRDERRVLIYFGKA
ncbi:MAG TPA: hypothetical protein VFO25_11830 [Candidatus Eremiobacteraceae bacterium]|nr:hypothetical protein [Candidatus Eremiobacteraceae bacterium]